MNILTGESLTLEAIREKCAKDGRYVMIMMKSGQRVGGFVELSDGSLILDKGEGKLPPLSMEEIGKMTSVEFLS